MTRRFIVPILVAVLAAAAHAQQAAPPKDQAPAPSVPSLTGKWAMAVNMTMGISRPALTLKQDGQKLTGTYAGRYGTFPIEGTLNGRAIELFLSMDVEGQKVEMSFAGEVAADGQSMRGDADLGQAGDATWTAAREKGLSEF
jgi:hypothetical protein